MGGFEGREYVIELPWTGSELRRPPLPWINVIANPHFGLLVSETGAGYTWARNSQANRLTPWSNDPVSDPHGEAFYLRDEISGVFWSPLPGPCPAPVNYQTRHGFGYSTFHSIYNDLTQNATIFVHREQPLRLLRLQLTNTGSAPRQLSLFSYQGLVMGNQPQTESTIVTAHDTERDVLTAINSQAGDFVGGIVFAAARLFDAEITARAHTADRLSFIGRHRDPTAPAALEPNAQLDGRCGSNFDSCLAQQLSFTLAPGQTVTAVFLLGEVLNDAELTTLLAQYQNAPAVNDALVAAREFWLDLVTRIQVHTPEPAIDLLLNGWITYQNLGCRIWARSAFYQSGGAFGYRDQLQDAAALVAIRPELTRQQILLHAAQQFVEGDVLHWWHPAPIGRGLRTRFADDLLWLPFVTAHYLRVTGDAAILDELIPFLTAPLLAPGEDEVYLQPQPSGETADLYEHCRRAIERSLAVGAHGLPLMGTGDWNDGMNCVGREGRGESVWMGFFLYRILGDFIPLAAARGDHAAVERYSAQQTALATALEISGWDGDWYRRAYDDDGLPLGSAANSECRIDALAQSWAVISGAVPANRAAQAMDALEAQLVDEANGLIRLLTPPFVDTPQNPGYIKGYVAGVRENGGQYTHAACWAVLALAQLGRRERAARLLAMLSPVSHTATPEAIARYRLEPYALAADVYGAEPHIGRGGWSWYTGSAGWWARVALEAVLGITIENGRMLLIRPCIPTEWASYQIDYRLPDDVTNCTIAIENGAGAGRVISAWLNPPFSKEGFIEVNDGTARIQLPPAPGHYHIHIQLGE
ncbi:glycosyl transferase [Chromatium weissei]|nr:glycosyl transferase [Chromatium weissei]